MALNGQRHMVLYMTSHAIKLTTFSHRLWRYRTSKPVSFKDSNARLYPRSERSTRLARGKQETQPFALFTLWEIAVRTRISPVCWSRGLLQYKHPRATGRWKGNTDKVWHCWDRCTGRCTCLSRALLTPQQKKDLKHWKSLYLAGRLQKPVNVIKDNGASALEQCLIFPYRPCSTGSGSVVKVRGHCVTPTLAP